MVAEGGRCPEPWCHRTGVAGRGANFPGPSGTRTGLKLEAVAPLEAATMRPIQINKMDKYATTMQSLEMVADVKEQPAGSKPLLGATMAAIKDLKTSLEPKLDAITIDVNLLQADLKKMA
ncbi:hypothetical protein NDU88_011279 [Pleurodeles waltl]|uniref:Uncharacterized protein n=1 Tax=Pleurodeles waltl TaxID=8319 RepID=A0AAV7QWS7_PLEWA|nr:hypothetical protein NDU88_011279 [Pleurodeles waltl]